MNNAVLDYLRGQRVLGIDPIEDYVQIVMEFNRISVLNPAWLTTPGSKATLVLEPQTELLGLIGRRVLTTILVPDAHLLFGLDDGTALSISLAPEDYTGAEGVIVSGENGWDVF